MVQFSRSINKKGIEIGLTVTRNVKDYGFRERHTILYERR